MLVYVLVLTTLMGLGHPIDFLKGDGGQKDIKGRILTDLYVAAFEAITRSPT
jgi:hypothetical protein